MSSWVDLGVGELDDFDFGINRGWVREHAAHLSRRFETPRFIVLASARTWRLSYSRRTTVFFDVDEVLPDMLAAQDLMKERGYPSRSKDRETWKVWSRALTAQGKRHKELLALVKSESPELAQLLDAWGGTAYAHGSTRPIPAISGAALRVSVQLPDGEVRLALIESLCVLKRDTFTIERARAHLEHLG
jgi:hypothetical protein